MTIRKLVFLLTCLPLVWIFPFPAFGAEPAPMPANVSSDRLAELLPSLREGGYVLYFRHALTEHDQEDRQPIVKDDCSTQRNLSERGRLQAKGIGAAFKRLAIPVARVISSPFCRCVDTARLAFGKYDLSEDLYFAVGLAKAERSAKGAALRRMLAEVPAPGGNTVIIAHTANLEEAVGFWPKPEGTAFLFRPDGKGGFAIIGRMPVELWLGEERR